MNIQDFAHKRAVQAVVAFGVIATAGYYFWLKKQKSALKWASADGKNKLLTTATSKQSSDPVYKECQKRCEGSSNYNECMYKCIDKKVMQVGF